MSSNPTSNTPADIAIVGMGCLFPRANHLGAYWANIKHGIDAIIETPESHWRLEDYYDADPKRPDFTYGKRGGFLEPIDFNPLEYGMPPNALEATDTAQLLGMVAADRTLRDAGYGPDADFDRDRVSVVVGVTGALELVIPLGARLGHPKWRQALQDAGLDQATIDDVLERMAEQYVPWQEASFPGLLGNVVAGRITKHLNLGGTNCVVDAACASSLSAVHLAMLELQAGKSDLVISGGVDTFNDIFMFMCFSKTPALSPTGNAKPFDASGDGTILGEGLGMVALKRLSDAERDNDRIYAVIKGIGASSDGKGDAIYAPSAKGQVKALRRAYEQAQIDPLTVELVEAHGTGTAKGDAVEISALTEVYGAAKNGPWCAIGSVKSQIGHTKAAAGSAALIKATLALYNKVLPPTIKVTDPLAPLKADDCAFYPNTKLRPWPAPDGHPRRAALSALGFGGSNFHAVLEEHGAAKAAPDWDGTVEILPFAAETPQALETLLDSIPVSDGWSALQIKASELRQSFRPQANCRLLLVLDQGADVAKILGQARSTLKAKAAEASWSLPNGVYYSTGAVPGKLAFVFPGQGTQYVGMLHELACQFPEFLEVLNKANAIYGTSGNSRLSDLIYPRPAFNEEAETRQQKALTATPVAPSAIGAVSAGALEVIRTFGLSADAVAGHSYGEIVGLFAAGKISETDFHHLSKLRGALMGQGEGDKGSMMAVRAEEAAVAALIAEAQLDVVIANKNAPEQMVLSGGTDAIAHANTVFSERGIQTKILPVAAAFHSEFVAHVREPFLEALQDMDIADGDVTLYANTTAAPYPTDKNAIRDLVAGQLAAPVSFVAQIQRMYDDGVRTFLEIGPGSRMSGLVDAILGAKPHHSIAIDGSNGKRSGIADLAHALAEAAALGYGVQLGNWNAGCPIDPEALKPRAKLNVPICGANHVAPRPKKPKAAPRPIVQTHQHQQPTGTTMTTTPSPTTPATQTPATAPAGAPHPMEQHLIALQRMQQQTAELHRQFLEGQQVALETFRSLLGQQPNTAPVSQPAVSPAAPVQAPFAPSAPAASAPAVSTPVAPSPAPTTPVPAAANTGKIERALLATIAEKTGYPADMLELSMALDADLGIDSIKRVEILSALKEQLPEAPEFGPDQLGQFHTLGDIVAYIAANSSAGAPVTNTSAPAAATVNATKVEAALLATIAEKTGYPADMLELSMALDADLGIDSIKRVEILSALKEQLPEIPEFGPEQLGQFQTLGDIVNYIAAGETTPAAAAISAPDAAVSPAPPAQARPAGDPLAIRAVTPRSFSLGAAAPLPAGATIAVIADESPLGEAIAAALRDKGLTVSALPWDAEPGSALPENMAGLVLVATDAKHDSPRAFAWIQVAGSYLKNRPSTLLASVTELDGAFGLTSTVGDPLTGGLAGLIKTAAHEWPTVACKAVDIAPGLDDVGARIIEALFHEGPTEIGITPDGFQTLTLETFDSETAAPAPVQPGEVVVVSGGARGVTADVALAMAKAWQPTLVLLGRSDAPTPEADWLQPLHTEQEIQQALIQRASGALKPKALRDALDAILRNRAALHNLEAMEAAGAQVEYFPVDIQDADAVVALLDEVRSEYGPIRGIVHGAGVLADRLIEDKTHDQFQRVYGTKVVGLQALLTAAADDDDVRFMAFFSSSTGRFGRKGQIDYAAANEVLNKVAQREARNRPHCRVVSVNWGPWAGGMVTDDLARLFKSEGVGLIGLEDGANFLVSELAQAPGRPVEVVVMGGEVPAFNTIPEPPHTKAAPSSTEAALAIDLSVDDFPFLRSHVLNNRAVLPVAMISEWLAHTALHAHPGLRFHGFDALRVFKGVTLDATEHQTVELSLGAMTSSPDGYLVPVELRSNPTGNKEILHAAAHVQLVEALPTAEARIKPREMEKKAYNNGGLYEGGHLFHGPAFQGLDAVDGAANGIVAALVGKAPAPKEWIRTPLRNTWIADPLILDSSFQMMILWTFRQYGVGSLPSFLARYRQFTNRFPGDGARILVQVTEHNKRKAVADIEFVDPKTGALLARIDGYECTLGAFLNKAFQNNTLEMPDAIGTDTDPSRR